MRDATFVPCKRHLDRCNRSGAISIPRAPLVGGELQEFYALRPAISGTGAAEQGTVAKMLSEEILDETTINSLGAGDKFPTILIDMEGRAATCVASCAVRYGTEREEATNMSQPHSTQTQRDYRDCIEILALRMCPIRAPRLQCPKVRNLSRLGALEAPNRLCTSLRRHVVDAAAKSPWDALAYEGVPRNAEQVFPLR